MPRNKYTNILSRTDMFLKVALDPTLAAIDDAMKAVEYVCSLAGQVPTPVGNPFAIAAFSIELDKSNYFEAMLYLLNSVPDLGAISSAIQNYSKILTGANLLLKSKIVPASIKKRIFWFLVGLYQNRTWVETAKEAFKTILETAVPTFNLKAYAKKIGVKVSNDIKQVAKDVTDKTIQEISNRMAQYATEMQKIASGI